ncbi:hypothetical protein BCR36DRAFT_416616 [Piromyces finnis]|uniref:Protein transport protein SFT2 n=1 Tax=Piromyces finnis TaxID=1754191 RepID=A0A1Y1UUM6_9FUNG|nr:hypothetical protein BCR36DRAFT_416616 [Piromyces finnis]|eukprot:ORX41719.1 hypothetical protein BCR36DRAFT_416616 [Piromyces finnis]
MDFKKLAKDIIEDSNEIVNDIKKKVDPVKINIIEENDGNIISNVTEGIAKVTSSVTNSISDTVDNAKSLSPEKLVSNMVKKVWKEDDKVFGLKITRGQKITYSLTFIILTVLFLGIDLSLLFIDHTFENVKYSVFFFIWTFSFLLGIRILDSAVPEQFFEKKTKTVRFSSIVLYTITLISGVIVANIYENWIISVVAFFIQLITFAWLATSHIPTFKGINFSYFTEKTPLLFSSFYQSVEH